MKKTIFASVMACIVLTIPGYLSLFAGAQMLDYQQKHSLYLYIGYVLMWPTMLAGYLVETITGGKSIGLGTLVTAQLSGYLAMGFAVHHVLKYLKKW